MPHEQAAPADLVLTGGTVLCLDEAGTRAEAIAVRDGRIVAVGSSAEIAAFATDAARVIDLDGRTVLPGINDSHLHATWLGAVWPATVFGGDHAHGEGADGPLLTGSAERRAAILRAGELIASLGITSYTEPGLGPGEDAGATGAFGQDVLAQYRALEREGLLKARVTALLLFGVLDGPSRLEDFRAGIAAASTATDRPEWLRVAGVKVFADGIPPMHQAWTAHEYPDGTSGGLLVAGEGIAERAANLRAMVIDGHRAGLQVGVHATGDRAIEAVADAVAEAMRDGAADPRHYVIHGDLATPAVLERMAALGVGINIQAEIATTTSAWVEGVLGAGVASAAWPIARAVDAGVHVCLSSDAPILSPDWRRGMAAADAWMGPAADATRRMDLLLRSYTTEPAWQDHAESWKGSIEAGKVADLTVVDRDPYTLTPERMPELAIHSTIVGGRVVFDAAEVPAPML